VTQLNHTRVRRRTGAWYGSEQNEDKAADVLGGRRVGLTAVGEIHGADGTPARALHHDRGRRLAAGCVTVHDHHDALRRSTPYDRL